MNTDTMTVTDTQKHFTALSEITSNIQDAIYNVASAMYCAINYLTMLHAQLDNEVAALFAAHKEGKI